MKTTYLLLCLLGIGSVSGAGQTKQPQKIGDFIESTSYNEHRRNATRSLQYTPDGDDFVCINGKNRFTRALYGSHTAFRLETSDRPVFAAYTKENPKHICFKLQTSGGTVALDSTEHCESRYTAGRRSYSLSDPAFGGGSLSITTWALPDKEGAIWQFNARNFKEFHPVLLASISEIRNSKLNRNGDMGADPADSFEAPLHPVLHVNARKEKIRSVKVNGVPATWQSIESAHGYPLLSIQAEGTSSTTITIEWEGAPLHTLAVQEPVITSNGKLALQIPSGASISQVYDPQSVLANHTVEATAFNAQIKGEPGHHTFFVYTHQGEMDWWQPVNIYIENVRESPSYTDFADIRPEKCRMVDFDRQLNASVTDIYQNEYLSPRSPYTTLQLPTQGIGEWCHPLLSATIDDSELRRLVHHDTFQTSLGIPFRLKEKGNNILFTSLWDNYPDSSTISLSGTASHAYLLMAGSTNHMQCHIANGIIRIHYADGTSQATELTNPDNWCPIEQDFYVDGKAFQATAPRPYRLHLKSGKISRDLGKELNITGVYGREIEGGAGILLDIPLDHSKELKGLTLETLSNDVVIGIMGITLQ